MNNEIIRFFWAVRSDLESVSNVALANLYFAEVSVRLNNF